MSSDENKTTRRSGNIQQNWFAMIKEAGSEEAAGKEVARQLRLAADQIESGKYPRVFGIELPNPNPDFDSFEDIMQTYSVTLSHPWPG